MERGGWRDYQVTWNIREIVMEKGGGRDYQVTFSHQKKCYGPRRWARLSSHLECQTNCF